MATFDSLQVTNYKSNNPYLSADERVLESLFQYGKLRLLRFDFTSPAGMAAADIVNIVRLPQGKVTVVGWLSQVRNGAFGAGITMSIGNAAYRNQLGNVVAANATALLAATSVAAAGTLPLNPAAPASGFLGSGIVGPVGAALQSFESINGVVLTGTFAGGAPLAGIALTGGLAIAVE